MKKTILFIFLVCSTIVNAQQTFRTNELSAEIPDWFEEQVAAVQPGEYLVIEATADKKAFKGGKNTNRTLNRLWAIERGSEFQAYAVKQGVEVQLITRLDAEVASVTVTTIKRPKVITAIEQKEPERVDYSVINTILDDRLKGFERRQEPYTWLRVRVGGAGSYLFEEGFRHAPFGINPEFCFDLTEISALNVGFILFDPEEKYGGYSGYIGYTWKFFTLDAMYSAFKSYPSLNGKDRASHISLALGGQINADKFRFNLGVMGSKELITADKNNGVKVVSLQDFEVGVMLRVQYELAILPTSFR